MSLSLSCVGSGIRMRSIKGGKFILPFFHTLHTRRMRKVSFQFLTCSQRTRSSSSSSASASQESSCCIRLCLGNSLKEIQIIFLSRLRGSSGSSRRAGWNAHAHTWARTHSHSCIFSQVYSCTHTYIQHTNTRTYTVSLIHTFVTVNNGGVKKVVLTCIEEEFRSGILTILSHSSDCKK